MPTTLCSEVRRTAGPFIWERRFALGLEDIDEQHRRLVHLLNAAATAEPYELPARLDDLLDDVAHHFAHEQHLLDTAGCPDRAAHRAEHRRFLEELGRLPSCPDELDDPWLLVSAIGQRIVDHMLTTDAAMARWLRQHADPIW